MPDLIIESVALSSLKPFKGNARLHDQRNIAAIKASLEDHGQVEPLLVRSDTSEVVGGSGRLAAMKQLEWTECKVIRLDIDERESEALNLRLNRTAEFATWDTPRLTEHLADLANVGIEPADLGWPDFDIGTEDIPPTLPAQESPLGLAEQVRQHTYTDDGSRGAIQYDNDGERPAMARPVHLTVDQREIFDRAKAVLISDAADGVPTSSGRALELICADWLAGH